MWLCPTINSIYLSSVQSRWVGVPQRSRSRAAWLYHTNLQACLQMQCFEKPKLQVSECFIPIGQNQVAFEVAYMIILHDAAPQKLLKKKNRWIALPRTWKLDFYILNFFNFLGAVHFHLFKCDFYAIRKLNVSLDIKCICSIVKWFWAILNKQFVLMYWENPPKFSVSAQWSKIASILLAELLKSWAV